MTQNLLELWYDITKSGGINSYINSELKRMGFLVTRKETLKMNKRELENYKKELKKEAEEKKKLKALTWKAYRSSHIVHLGEGIFWNDTNDCDAFDIKNGAIRAADNELPILDTPEKLAEAMGMSVPQLRWLTYHRDMASRVHYKHFTIPKKDGTVRHIWAPMTRLKAAQGWVLKNIVEKLPMHGAAHGFIPSRSTYSNALVHSNAALLIKIDIKDFFPTITYPRVKGIFRKAGLNEQVSTLLALICTESPREEVERNGKKYFVSLGQRALPQGAPTSPALTNVLFLRVDRRIAGLAEKLGIRYSRYADDLTFSLSTESKQNPKEFNSGKLVGLIRRILEDEGFTMHPTKTKILTNKSCQRVTGLVVNDGAPRVPRELKRKVRAMLCNLKNGKPLHEGETIEQLRGYIAYISMSSKELGEKFKAELIAQK